VLRRRVGLTQAQLAERVDTSQSLIARIERGQVNPSVETLRRILEVIEQERQVHSRVKDLLKWKRQTSKLPPLVWVAPTDKVRRAVLLMRRFGISQLPVLHNRSPVGSIYERTIIRHLVLAGASAVFSRSIQEIMEAPFPVVESDEHIEVAFDKMASGVEAMLVMDHGRPAGVLTKIDMISFTRYW
jgi:predicted transcriptional regulator